MRFILGKKVKKGCVLFERILKTLQARKNVFLTGGAGTGKSYTTKCIIEHFYKSGKNVVALGSTGISAVNIGGITLHSFFRFGRINDINELADICHCELNSNYNYTDTARKRYRYQAVFYITHY